ncbi:aminotransferase class I/II-fold pyridoxal phosphate-dependent enzyme [Amaricoccus sp.]|uniref:pyridoxal phosphate-dependent decarboxylase family protein n=1 Tax=Amaricoccus sp. TaxID=1872485 RepID=UPI001B68DD7C|nr:aminotransferase class I/II-fold pyridoxal phosphate-dependent enzyme [Amaricoccus sp.]MBP7002569.1 aminotransferase class I/II-fold pyridoxal phosphate-dependent enzyme [Amaricoccus sp.]
MTEGYPSIEVDDPFAYPADTLGLDPEEMRRLGYKVVDMVVDRQRRKAAEPAILTGSPAGLMAQLGGALPEDPIDPDASLELMARAALSHQQHGDHPRYFARVPGPCSFAAILGEWMGTGFNTISSSWGGGSGPAVVEMVVIEWMRQMLGLPEGTEGVLVSGGSIGNLTGFAAARSELGHGVAYCSDQTHSSLPRGLREMGCPTGHVRILESDDGYRMSVERLKAAIAEDKAAGKRPLLAVATAGSTNTGAADPLPEIADLCAAENMWLHVDGAYGGPAAITEEGRHALAGIERADSLTLDPHKWFFQPYDVGACFVMRPGALERCYAMSPEYLKDVQAATGAVNFGNRSLELTRRSRALKLWMSIRTYGARKFRAAVQQGIDNARIAEACLRERSDVWEIVTPAQIGVVCFALRDAKPGEHAERARIVSESGFACVSSTALKGRSVLRLCTINPLTTRDDIARTIDMLARPT